MDRQKTVLLVEDNKHLNQINRRALTRASYRVLTALTLAAAREHLKTDTPDAIILDIMLPDGDGVSFCKEIREHIAAPILFLTSVTGYEQTLEGLAAGGDDYLNKPFDLNMLLAKIAAFLRRDEIVDRVKPMQNALTRGALVLDTIAQQAFLSGKDMLLTPKEFALLLLLVQNEGKMLTKEALYETVWNQPLAEDDGALRKQMSRLKKKLDESETVVLTVSRGEGYRIKITE